MEENRLILRVFPRRTKATPEDIAARFDVPGMFDEADAVHVSVTFSWDLERAEFLSRAWSAVAPVKIGGPATGMRGEDFTPGMYVKQGYVITSRGCPNSCWFCSVWKRDGGIRELPITEGHNVLDDNLLACSDAHVMAVFDMLKKQRGVEFTGGLEAARLKEWHVNELSKIKPKQMFFAYDSDDDLEPLVAAGKLLQDAGFSKSSHAMRCYVLFGFKGDTPDAAHGRFIAAMKAGFMPMAMFFRPDGFRPITKEWHDLQWLYSRPAAMRKEYMTS